MKIGISLPIGINLQNFAEKVEDLKVYRKLGLQYLDVSLPNLSSFLTSDTISQNKIGNFLLGNPLGFSYTTHGRYTFSPNFDQLTEEKKALEDIDISKKINATNINFHFPYEVCFRRLSQGEAISFSSYLQKVMGYAEKHNLVASWENTVALKFVDGQWLFDQRIEIDDYNYNLKTIEDIIAAPVPLTFDTGHFVVMRDNPTDSCLDFLREHRHRLKMFHIHDNNGLSDKHYFPVLGEGVINWSLIMDTLSSFDAPAILEIDRDFSKIDAQKSVTFLLKNLNH